MKRLPEGVDEMGENGEFHTHVYHHDKGVAEARKKEEEEELSESESGDGGSSAGAV